MPRRPRTPRTPKRVRGRQTFATKTPISIRLHADTVDRYRRLFVQGWQSQMSRDLDEAIRRHETSTRGDK